MRARHILGVEDFKASELEMTPVPASRGSKAALSKERRGRS